LKEWRQSYIERCSVARPSAGGFPSLYTVSRRGAEMAEGKPVGNLRPGYVDAARFIRTLKSPKPQEATMSEGVGGQPVTKTADPLTPNQLVVSETAFC